MYNKTNKNLNFHTMNNKAARYIGYKIDNDKWR